MIIHSAFNEYLLSTYSVCASIIVSRARDTAVSKVPVFKKKKKNKVPVFKT